MTTTPKTIQIFLPIGDPHGIRVAEITNRIVRVVEVPRILLSDFLKMPEGTRVALYFLIGGTQDGGDLKVYIGQTGDLTARLTTHDKEKRFWTRALVLVSQTNSLTQTHTLFLEWYCLQAAKRAARYANENGNGGSKPHTPAPLEADCLEIFEIGRTLLSTLGHPIFDPVVAPTPTEQQKEIFVCRASGTDGRGLFTQEGFVVLKGSLARKECTTAFAGTRLEQVRLRLIDSGVLEERDGALVFTKDHLFNSPSIAAVAMLGRHANGWRTWKTPDGRTLDEVKRQVAPK